MRVQWLKGIKKGQVEDIDLASALGLIDGGYIKEMPIPYTTKDDIHEPVDADEKEDDMRKNIGITWAQIIIHFFKVKK